MEKLKKIVICVVSILALGVLGILGYTYGEEIWTDVTNALNPPKTEQPAPEPTPEDNVELTVKYEI